MFITQTQSYINIFDNSKTHLKNVFYTVPSKWAITYIHLWILRTGTFMYK